MDDGILRRPTFFDHHPKRMTIETPGPYGNVVAAQEASGIDRIFKPDVVKRTMSNRIGSWLSVA